MALYHQFPNTPLFDLPFKNYSGSDIIAGQSVAVDPTNVISGTNVAVGIINVAASGNPVIGVTLSVVKAGAVGTVRVLGLVEMVADGAITAGQPVDASATANKPVKAHAAGKAQLGLALSTAADGDPVLIFVNPAAYNA